MQKNVDSALRMELPKKEIASGEWAFRRRCGNAMPCQLPIAFSSLFNTGWAVRGLRRALSDDLSQT
jgi:hypothetical protein